MIARRVNAILRSRQVNATVTKQRISGWTTGRDVPEDAHVQQATAVRP
ncbi:hypothetical protein [Nonomuraea sp. SYSU D8015]|nr:hypothetical protein [Nonomuraea sp. SYSU D8015]